MSVVNITLVRHGQTTKNLEQKIQSRTDALLSELGESQCDSLGLHLAQEKFTHVFASDLRRTQQTAQRILKRNPHIPTPEIIIDSRLRERDFGDYEDTDVQDVFNRALKLGIRMHRLLIPNGEPYQNFAQKGLNFFEEICELTKSSSGTNNESDYNILLVSHGGWILTLFDSLIANPKQFELENFVVDESIRSPVNSSFTKLAITSNEDSSSNKFLVKFHTIFNISHLMN